MEYCYVVTSSDMSVIYQACVHQTVGQWCNVTHYQFVVTALEPPSVPPTSVSHLPLTRHNSKVKKLGHFQRLPVQVTYLPTIKSIHAPKHLLNNLIHCTIYVLNPDVEGPPLINIGFEMVTQ